MTKPSGLDDDNWKEKYRALEKEYDDFREQSQSLERELEMDAETLEKSNKELKSKNNQLQFDLDTLRVRSRWADFIFCKTTAVLYYYNSFTLLRIEFCCRQKIEKNSKT